jgi:L-arabinokinase
MFRIESGSTHGLSDTVSFIDRLNELRLGSRAEFFLPRRELFVTRAPGRLDWMGGIADYSGSLVLELPIANATHAALQLQPDRSIRLVSLRDDSLDAPRTFEMPLADFLDEKGKAIEYADAARYFGRHAGDIWAAYVAGAFLVLMRETEAEITQGASLLISSSVPEGKGVSSSASLEVAAMKAIAEGYRIELDARQLAFLCQKVENLVACAPCGVMDQMTAACGEADRLLALLCQPGELQGTVALPAELAVWGIDSGIRHSVGGADYGTVRTAAFMGYRMIADMAGLPWRESNLEGRVEVEDGRWGGYLANINPAEFEATFADQLPIEMRGTEFLERYRGITDTVTFVEHENFYPVRPATEHPIREHARVSSCFEILRNWRGESQAKELGELMYESHASYSACGLGSDGTDLLVRLVRERGAAAGLFGAKITGGGSGGTVAVLGLREALEAVREVADAYSNLTGRDPFVIEGSSPGADAFGHLRMVDEN